MTIDSNLIEGIKIGFGAGTFLGLLIGILIGLAIKYY